MICNNNIKSTNSEGFEIVEFKASMTIMPEMFKGLDYFSQLSGWEHLKKTLVYGGNDTQKRTAGTVTPWKKFRQKNPLES